MFLIKKFDFFLINYIRMYFFAKLKLKLVINQNLKLCQTSIQELELSL